MDPSGSTSVRRVGSSRANEADALIARLEMEADRGTTAAEPGGGAEPGPEPVPALSRREAELANRLHELPAEVLAAELQRRGWVVMEP